MTENLISHLLKTSVGGNWCFSGPHRRSRAASSCTQMDNRRSRGTSSLPRCPMNTCFTSLNGLVAPLSLMCEDVPVRQHSRCQPSRATSWVNNSPSRPPVALLGCYLSAGFSKKGKAVSLPGDIFSSSWGKTGLVDAAGGVERSWWWMNV